MLGFHLGTGGIKLPGQYIGGLTDDDVFWLQQNEFIEKGTSGHFPEDLPESLPYGDDVILDHSQVERMYEKFQKRFSLSYPEKGNKSVDALKVILELAINAKSGLSTIAD